MQYLIRARALGLAVLGACAAAQAADGEQWEYTMSLQAQGMSMPMGTIKTCRVPASSLKPGLGENCKLEDYKRTGNTASFRAVCGPPQPSVMSGEMTRTGDTMSGTFRLEQGGQTMVMKQTARNLGSCANPVE
jgi:hypothetical protein